MFCDCGSQRHFQDCCGLYLGGQGVAPTAEALMRSRYTAYCRGNLDYLVSTHHPTRRQPGEQGSLRRTCQTTTWLGLTVLQVLQGQPTDATGVVEFVALYRAGGGDPQQLHERSRFTRSRQRWFYLDGEQLPPLRPQRNQPCWCGSGKKFKHCHG